jgi:hypothetical protein
MAIMANAITTSAFHAAVGHWLDMAQHAPVTIAKHRRPFAVLVSAQLWEQLGGAAATVAAAAATPAPELPGAAVAAPGAPCATPKAEVTVEAGDAAEGLGETVGPPAEAITPAAEGETDDGAAARAAAVRAHVDELMRRAAGVRAGRRW